MRPTLQPAIEAGRGKDVRCNMGGTKKGSGWFVWRAEGKERIDEDGFVKREDPKLQDDSQPTSFWLGGRLLVDLVRNGDFLEKVILGVVAAASCWKVTVGRYDTGVVWWWCRWWF